MLTTGGPVCASERGNEIEVCGIAVDTGSISLALVAVAAILRGVCWVAEDLKLSDARVDILIESVDCDGTLDVLKRATGSVSLILLGSCISP